MKVPFSHHAHVNPKWINDLDSRRESISYIEKNIVWTLDDTESRCSFNDIIPLAKQMVEKKIGLHQTEKLLHYKRNQ